MKGSVKCPYCDTFVAIHHDIKRETNINHVTCGACEKVFFCRTWVQVMFDSRMAPCLNGGHHQCEEISAVPSSPMQLQCVHCGLIAVAQNVSRKPGSV